ncbi:hypothetical protein DB345_12360 [Spartobacteria bacterium LR76]|nr:hypothetical protein DB345_12360 [Spartobacteria bacterium LR76]
MKRESRKAAAKAETIEVTIKDTEGNVIDVGNWSLELWNRGEELGRKNGLTMDHLISKLIATAYAAKSGDEERVNVAISGKHMARIEHMAEILETSVEEMTDSILEGYLDDIYDHGRVGEHEACERGFDSLKQAKRAARKADEHDMRQKPRMLVRKWEFQKDDAGLVWASYDPFPARKEVAA